MKNLGYYNGKYGPLEEMTIPMNDRGCYFGDGVYEVTLCSNYTMFAADEHINRFYNNAEMLSIHLPMEKEALKAALQEMIKKLDSPNQIIYWQATRGTAERAHVFPENAAANLWMMLRPFAFPDIKQHRRLTVMEDTRFLHCNIKTLNLLPNIMASQKAASAGCYEAVFHRNGRVTEGSRSNISIIKDGVLKTAPCDNLILPGIIRARIIQICKSLNIPAEEVPFTLDELFNADEILVSSSSSFFVMTDQIDGKPVGGNAYDLALQIQCALISQYCQETGSNINNVKQQLNLC